jgi:hypothetical protein
VGLLFDCDSLEPFTNGVPLDIDTWERQFGAWWAGWRVHWATKADEVSGAQQPALEDTVIPAGQPDPPICPTVRRRHRRFWSRTRPLRRTYSRRSRTTTPASMIGTGSKWRGLTRTSTRARRTVPRPCSANSSAGITGGGCTSGGLTGGGAKVAGHALSSEGSSTTRATRGPRPVTRRP